MPFAVSLAFDLNAAGPLSSSVWFARGLGDARQRESGSGDPSPGVSDKLTVVREFSEGTKNHAGVQAGPAGHRFLVDEGTLDSLPGT